jgi:hypothetical protein
MPPIIIVSGRRRSGQWRVRKGALAPYRVVDPVSGQLLPTRVRRGLLMLGMRQNGLTPVDAIRRLNAVRNYLKNQTSPRSAAIRRAYTRDIMFLQQL